MFTTPILVIIFNRPDFANNIFSALSQLKPTKLYVISDGPRNPTEALEVWKSREILNNVNWECDVKYDYSDVNLGLYKRISGGITWAFQAEEKLIILEDDCIPNIDFFQFCEELLTFYENDPKIMSVNGCNLNPEISLNSPESYFFTRYANSWGWATWKRAWNLFDKDLSGLDDKKISGNFSKNLPNQYRSRTYWRIMLNKVKKQKIDSWAYRWMFTLWSHNGLAVVPKTNLIQNIGNDKRSTNTRGKLHYINIRTSNMGSNSQRPKSIQPNEKYDQWLEDTIYSKTFTNRTIWLIKKLFSLTNRH
jgi:hypothetical protein